MPRAHAPSSLNPSQPQTWAASSPLPKGTHVIAANESGFSGNEMVLIGVLMLRSPPFVTTFRLVLLLE